MRDALNALAPLDLAGLVIRIHPHITSNQRRRPHATIQLRFIAITLQPYTTVCWNFTEMPVDWTSGNNLNSA